MSTVRWLRVVALALTCGGAVPATASAQSLMDTAKLIGGAAAGLVIHESAHVAADFANGVSPGVKKVTFGAIPFFAITHDPVSPGREFVISSAGFWAQHAVSEYLLTARPELRDEHSPVLKGLLAFNVLTSAAYSVAAFARIGPDERDTRGMAISARVDEPVIGALILAPAILDSARYFGVRHRWVVWASRAAKVGGALLVVRAVR
ncbi:MAG TPA: hypothetical protein VM819_07450 [Vicinamibacterales bacterium]|nr:hypothetical protein [Vicinamibacterales bacterium]